MGQAKELNPGFRFPQSVELAQTQAEEIAALQDAMSSGLLKRRDFIAASIRVRALTAPPAGAGPVF